MCDACTTASQHFGSGTQPGERVLQTSVQQGTSPDWHAADSSTSDEHDYR